MLAYNCSPSFNWQKKLAPERLASFQHDIAQMGYRFQFVTLAGFHSLNLAMFQLARDYSERGMAAYSELQQAEFAADLHQASARGRGRLLRCGGDSDFGRTLLDDGAGRQHRDGAVPRGSAGRLHAARL